MSQVPASKREWRGPESGILLDSDDNQFDLTELLKGLEFLKNGQVHVRVHNPSGEDIISDILGELKKINQQLSFITGEEL